MRPPRVAILVLFSSASIFLIYRAITTIRHSGTAAASLASDKSWFRSLFSFSAPLSLFPPSAAISLTDDNSTFFAARPAAFGPPLPSDGLNGRLWIGSGFADDSFQEGESEGELGCSDVPGWEDGRSELAMKKEEQGSGSDKFVGPAGKAKRPRSAGRESHPLAGRQATSSKRRSGGASHIDDGTDDYLHQGLHTSKGSFHEPTTNLGSSHADIQSIQETAEITGKIVLLSRGGCGFLEKVKWAQRRGAIALIVGDNQKGGPLIQMFARGNVDNVTIPSVFTSRTTAHILSSLMQPGSFIEDILDENGNPVLKVQQSGKRRKSRKPKETGSPSRKAAAKPKPTRIPSIQEESRHAADKPAHSRRSWISRLLRWGSDDVTSSDRSQPRRSGHHDWVIVDEWSDEKDKAIKSGLDKASKNSGDSSSASGAVTPQGDGFQIGVQDWRDPDLVSTSSQDKAQPSSTKDGAGADGSGLVDDPNGPKGGIITPGSGEYSSEPGADSRTRGSTKGDASSTSPGGLISKIFGDDAAADGASNSSPTTTSPPSSTRTPGGGGDGMEDGEGLWVTITPTSNASPFLDTLLILVISPLITLTVVYALLLVRAKLRRRRWRAPKSVVERLPVRTYQTITPSPNHSPRLPSPPSSSPTAPLLQGSQAARPRSRTTTGVPASEGHFRSDNGAQAGGSSSELSRSHGSGSSQWKKYMGKQVECVVCLEEYIDGVSRVMSLPCGHEFHAECITPWLTTRRRTCPICKGDVVRSLARGMPSSPRYDAYRDDSDDEDDNDDAEASNPGPSRSQPGPPARGRSQNAAAAASHASQSGARQDEAMPGISRTADLPITDFRSSESLWRRMENPEGSLSFMAMFSAAMLPDSRDDPRTSMDRQIRGAVLPR